MRPSHEQTLAKARAILVEAQLALDKGDMERAARLLLKLWMVVELLSRTIA